MLPLSTIDLHLHTYYSDGRASPQELLEYAAANGMQIIAITDHDNARGAREARPFAEQLGLTLIPAIELTCRWDLSQAPPGKTDIDILGYFLDLDRPDFQAFEREILNDFRARSEIACQHLSTAGYPIGIDDILQENPHYVGTHPLIKAVIRKGYAASHNRALELIDSIWKNVRPSNYTIDQVIAVIRQAGGVPVLAHPSIVPWPSGWLNAEAIHQLVSMGLEGMEIYHPRLNAAARRYFLSLADQFGLLITGGSDDHGWPEGFLRLGSQEVTSGMVSGLREKASQNQKSAYHRISLANL